MLTHTDGHAYGGAVPFGSFGFDPNVVGVYRGVANRVGPGGTAIPEGFPNPASPLSNNGSASLQIWADTYAQIPLLFQPGSQWAYGPAEAILGRVIETVDPQGRGLEQFMKEELYDKIGMPDTGFFVQGGPGDPIWEDKVGRFAVLYDNSFAPAIPFIPVDSLTPPAHAPIAALAGFLQTVQYAGPRQLPLADAGIFSTMQDYVKFLEVILNNGKTKSGEVILSPAMIATLTRNQINDRDTLALYGVLSNDFDQAVKQMKYGLGSGLNQGVNIETTGASRKQLAWEGLFRTQYALDFSNRAIFQVGTSMLDLSSNNLLMRDCSLARSLLMNALNKVNTFDEQLYTPGTAAPYDFNQYVAPA